MKESIIDQLKETATILLLEKKGVTRYRTKSYQLNKDLHFSEGKIFYKDRVCGNYNEQERQITIFHEKGLNNKGLNVITSHPCLLTDATINILDGKNEHTVKTDSLGRRSEILNKIKQKNSGHKINNRFNDEQTKAKLFNDEEGYVDTIEQEKDQGGHALAASAGGLKEMINIFPQAFKVNNCSEWRRLDQIQRSLYQNGKEFTSQIFFEYKGISRRPSGVRIKVQSEKDCWYAEFNNSNSASIPAVRIPVSSCREKENSSKKIIKLPLVRNSKTLKTSIPTGSIKHPFLRPKIIVMAIILLLFVILLLFFRNCSSSSSVKEVNPIVDSEKNIIYTNEGNKELFVEDNSLRFAGPLDTLTHSITDYDNFEKIINEQKIIPVAGVMFEYNSSQLSETDLDFLEHFYNARLRVSIPNYILLEGFTCTIGSEENNRKLGESRATALKSILISLGVEDTDIRILPIGKERFFSTDNQEYDLQANRRSNITLIAKEEF